MSAPLNKHGFLINPPRIGQKFRISTPHGVDVTCQVNMIRYVNFDTNTHRVWDIRFEPDNDKFMNEFITADGFMMMLRQRKIVAI